ncbi:MAG: dienelactone hydrolase family protein [Acidobacteriia bacterium]|nr:dienelactone hydrolase family protein [Terriglobia bacterium]
MKETELEKIHSSRRLIARTIWAPLIAVAASFLTLSAARVASRPAQDADIDTDSIHFDSSGIPMDAFIAKPKSGGQHPAVLVIHGEQGLDDSMRVIARQFAAAGFVALAPDLTSRLRGTRAPAQMAAAVRQLPPNRTLQDLRAAFAFLQKDAGVDSSRISSVGYGWGGWRSFMLAALVSELYRAVVYSGATPTQGFDDLRAPLLANYAQYDFRTTGNALQTEKAMTGAGKKFTYFVYPGVQRAFYSEGPQYDAAAAKLAWTRTLDFLQK